MVLAPVAIYQLLEGNMPGPGEFLIGWLVIVCIRQVVEPRLVSPLEDPLAGFLSRHTTRWWPGTFGCFFMCWGCAACTPPFRETGPCLPVGAASGKTALRRTRSFPRIKASPAFPGGALSVVSSLYPAGPSSYLQR